MKLSESESIIESILFATGASIDVRDIAEAVGINTKDTDKLIKNLMNKYEEENRGMRIIEIESSYQMCTNAEYFNYIKNLCSVERKKSLSPSLLETLAIVAYKQPVTKAQIEGIRGVNADHAVYTLMKYGLIDEKGRLDAPGRPILFGTTDEFLKFFGFSSLSQLPEVKEASESEIMEDIENNNISLMV